MYDVFELKFARENWTRQTLEENMGTKGKKEGRKNKRRQCNGKTRLPCCIVLTADRGEVATHAPVRTACYYFCSILILYLLRLQVSEILGMWTVEQS
jgi:hypothetical protein